MNDLLQPEYDELDMLVFYDANFFVAKEQMNRRVSRMLELGWELAGEVKLERDLLITIGERPVNCKIVFFVPMIRNKKIAESLAAAEREEVDTYWARYGEARKVAETLNIEGPNHSIIRAFMTFDPLPDTKGLAEMIVSGSFNLPSYVGIGPVAERRAKEAAKAYLQKEAMSE